MMARAVGLAWVFLDVGGPLFSDAAYFSALFEAIRERAPGLQRQAYDERFAQLRAAQSEGFTEALVGEFVTDESAHTAVRRRADVMWERTGYGPDEVFPDVVDTLRVLAKRYRLACITNHF